VTGWWFGNMALASLLMLAVLAIRLPVARWLGAGAAYALWLVPALRLAAPPLPSFSSELAPLPDLVLALEIGGAPAGAEAAMIGWSGVLLGSWAVGAAGFLVWHWLAYRTFLTRLSLSSRSAGEHRGIPLMESGAVQGPIALGLLDRRIVVPADFTRRYSAEERALALDHEAVHHRRGDIWWNHLALLVLALNWFNPVAWIAFRAFRADQELACDAAVIARRSSAARGDYAEALVKSVSPGRPITAAPLNQVDQLKRRLKMLKTHRGGLLRTLGGMAVVANLAAVGALLGSPGIAHPHPEDGKQERRERIIVRTDRHGGGGEARHREHREHRVEIRRGGHGGHVETNCDGERTNIDEGSGDQRARIVLCSRGDSTPAQRAEHLQRSRERLAGDPDLSAETRNRITAALDREISRLRGQ
jgi:bla regulator protein blaR1